MYSSTARFTTLLTIGSALTLLLPALAAPAGATLVGDTITANATWQNAPLGPTPLLVDETATVDASLVEFSVPIPPLGGSEFSIDFFGDQTFTVVFDPADLSGWPIQIDVSISDLDFDPPASITAVQQTSSSTSGFLDVISFTANSIDIGSSVENAFGATFSATFSYTTEGSAPNTPVGTNVVVTPQDQTSGGFPATLTFEEVTSAGETSLVTSANGPNPPAEFRLCDTPTYFELATTATTAPGSSIEVCIDYSSLGCDAIPPSLWHYEDTTADGNPDSWVDVTTNYTGSVVCGVVENLSPFAVFVPREKFSFDMGFEEDWTLQGAFRETGGDPVSNNFAFGWFDDVDAPGPIPNDPIDGNRGAIGFTTPGGHGVPSAGNTYWIMRFYSPDLSEIPEWQGARGFTVRVGEDMAATSTLFANLFVVAFDLDQGQERFFFNGAAAPLILDDWTPFSFDWISGGGFPSNYVIRRVFVNIWGTMSGSYAGGVYLDDVALLPGPTAVAPPVPKAAMARLLPPSPNPFNPRTTLRFELELPGTVDLGVYDLSGRRVRQLISRTPFTAGTYDHSWDGRDDQGRMVGSGVYVARLHTEKVERMRKMVLLK